MALGAEDYQPLTFCSRCSMSTVTPRPADGSASCLDSLPIEFAQTPCMHLTRPQFDGMAAEIRQAAITCVQGDSCATCPGRRAANEGSQRLTGGGYSLLSLLTGPCIRATMPSIKPWAAAGKSGHGEGLPWAS
jgi:hypothetical protein